MKAHVATLCICTVYLSNFVLCRPPISLQIEKQTIIEVPAETINLESNPNEIEAINKILNSFLTSEQNKQNNDASGENNIKTSSNAGDTHISSTRANVVVPSLSDKNNVKSREVDMTMNSESEITPESVILISPLLNRLLNNQALSNMRDINILNTENERSKLINTQDQLKRFNMYNTVYNIDYLMKNKLLQLNGKHSNKSGIQNNHLVLNRRWLPLIYYTPFVQDDQILDVSNEFPYIISFDPEDCCGQSYSRRLQNSAFLRINKAIKPNQPEALQSRMMKQYRSSKRTNDKFSSDMDNSEEMDADIIMENISLNGPIANYRAEGHNQQKIKYDQFPELRINNPFERTTTAPPPILNNDGIYINKLKIRKGGIAIAGPNGVATAGSGGTAIVGPGGLAYTKPNGLAVAGPGARVISVPSTTNLRDFFMNIDSFAQRRSNAGDIPIPEGARIVALGPIIYYNQEQDV